MKHRQPGLFNVEERAAQLTQMGDPLVGLKARIDWEAFRPELNRVHKKDRKSQAGAKPFDVVLMFKILILQHLHNLSDDGTALRHGISRKLRPSAARKIPKRAGRKKRREALRL